MRRLNSWTFLVVVLIPLIVVQQLLGPQRRTAVVNICLLLVVLGCRAWAVRGGADRRAHVSRAHDLILVATVLDLVVTALLRGRGHRCRAGDRREDRGERGRPRVGRIRPGEGRDVPFHVAGTG